MQKSAVINEKRLNVIMIGFLVISIPPVVLSSVINGWFWALNGVLYTVFDPWQILMLIAFCAFCGVLSMVMFIGLGILHRIDWRFAFNYARQKSILISLLVFASYFLGALAGAIAFVIA